MLSKDKETWYTAKEKCKGMNEGYDLVSIMSEDENNFIIESMKFLELGNAWIGLSYNNHEGNFTWSDGSRLLYGNRYYIQPWWNGNPDKV